MIHHHHFDSHAKLRGGLNYRFVLRVLGVLCLIQVPLLLIAFLVGYHFGVDEGTCPVGITAAVMLVAGALMTFLGRYSSRYDAGRRESLLSVSISWFVVAILGMLPLYLGHFVPTLCDAFFETIAGVTTTGASVIRDVEALPRSILFWRSILQWEGGIGIVVFLVAFLPLAGESADLMFNDERIGMVRDRFIPRIGVLAKWIILIYVVLSILCVLLLWAGPMSLFDAVCHGATCISTGGLSTKNNSIEYYDSVYINWILAIFMVLGATSFKLIYVVTIGRQPKKLFQDQEFRWFILLIAIFSLAGAAWLYFSGYFGDPLSALERSAFTIVSIFSSSSFSFGDYSMWGSFFGLLVLVSMFISGCSNSTAGGLKIVRFEILFMSLNKEIRKRMHPNAVIPYRMGNRVLSEQSVYGAMTFFFSYLSLILIATFTVTLEGYDFVEALSTATSCISNSGAGLGHFGPAYGFADLTAFNKLLLALLMVMGRLEIFTVLALCHRAFWRT